LYRKNSQLYQISPYISLKTNKGEHLLKTQFLNISLDYNPVDSIKDSDISSKIYYLDYKYKRQIDQIKSNIIIGSSSKITFANADVFSGTNYMNTNSIYTLLEKKTQKTTFSLGSRYEMVRMKSKEKFSYTGKDSTNEFSINFPIFYAGISHKINNNNSLRTYLGQGVRFPSIAEMFVSTDALEGASVLPNTSLKPESGWNFELGYNVGYKRTDLKWNLDLSYFLMRYENMMEFGFEQFGTEFDEEHAFGLGFKTINVGSTQISGVEAQLESEFNVNPKTSANIILGYTYMNPIALNPEEIYTEIEIGDSIAGYITKSISFLNSSSDPTILKYRYQHLLKMDARFEYKIYSFGVNLNYNDYMKNIDYIFTTDLVNEGYYYPDTIQVYAPIIPGINKSREMNKKGDLLIDLSIGVRINPIAKLNFIINNATNAEIYTRPTNLLAPRRYSVKLKLNI
jgi:iron complex outermembrane receptor protein